MRAHKPLLEDLVKRGKPLAEIVVLLSEGEQPDKICTIFNELALDVSAEVLPAYFQSDERNLRYQLRLDTTKEFLLREFGWSLERVKIYDSSEDNGQFQDGYAWREINKPKFYPSNLQGKIETMGLTQPGKGDNGLIDNVFYELKQS